MVINIVMTYTLSEEDTSFMSDAENWVLEKKWRKDRVEIMNEKRLSNNLWKELILENTEITWWKYEIYVLNGGGDEWFVEED